MKRFFLMLVFTPLIAVICFAILTAFSLVLRRLGLSDIVAGAIYWILFLVWLPISIVQLWNEVKKRNP